jgi:hypothetical protein
MLKEPFCSIDKCTHFSGVSQPDGTELTEVNYCEYYPEGIPDDIAYEGSLCKYKTIERA